MWAGCAARIWLRCAVRSRWRPAWLRMRGGGCAHCALAVIEAVYVSTAVAAGVELFTTRVRYSGFSIGYNVCVAAFGGTTRTS